VLRVESGDARVMAQSWHALLQVSAGRDPFVLIKDGKGQQAFQHASSHEPHDDGTAPYDLTQTQLGPRLSWDPDFAALRGQTLYWHIIGHAVKHSGSGLPAWGALQQVMRLPELLLQATHGAMRLPSSVGPVSHV
jgi:hypothetical protein